MKYRIAFCVMMLLSASVYAQTSHRFTLAAGIQDYVVLGYGTKLGYKFGPGIEFKKEESMFTYALDFLISSKGTSGSDYSGKYKMELHYLEVPATVAMKWNISKDWKIGWTNGLYVAYAFRGKSKTNDEKYVSAFCDDNIWGKKIPRIDFGYLTGIFVEQGRYVLGINFEMGLMPLCTNTYYGSGDYYDDTESFTAANIGGFLSFTIKF